MKQRRRVWKTVMLYVAKALIVMLPALLLPVSLVTRVEAKQVLPVMVVTFILSIASLIIASRFSRSLINSALEQDDENRSF